MSVIKRLVINCDLVDYNSQQNKIEENFVQCDQKLDGLLEQHGNELFQVMDRFKNFKSTIIFYRQ